MHQAFNFPYLYAGLDVCGALAGASTIRINDTGLSRMAAEHVIGLGTHPHSPHDRLCRTEPGLQAARGPPRRLGAAMKSARLGVRPEWQVSADFTIQGAYGSARKLLGTAERPTAGFAVSDEMAIGIILAGKQGGAKRSSAVPATVDREYRPGPSSGPVRPYRRQGLVGPSFRFGSRSAHELHEAV